MLARAGLSLLGCCASTRFKKASLELVFGDDLAVYKAVGTLSALVYAILYFSHDAFEMLYDNLVSVFRREHYTRQMHLLFRQIMTVFVIPVLHERASTAPWNWCG